MRSVALAALLVVSTGAAAMALPTFSLPDLTFPAPTGDVTQGCSNLATGEIVCE